MLSSEDPSPANDGNESVPVYAYTTNSADPSAEPVACIIEYSAEKSASKVSRTVVSAPISHTTYITVESTVAISLASFKALAHVTSTHPPSSFGTSVTTTLPDSVGLSSKSSINRVSSW